MNTKLKIHFCLILFSFSAVFESKSQSGNLDLTFASTGFVITAIGSGDDNPVSVVVQSDGKILVGGASNTGTNLDFAIVRYNTNGTLDNTFGLGGIVTTAVGTSDDIIFSLAIQSDGKILAGGQTKVGTYNDFAVLRYNTNGSLDNTFDGDGIVTTSTSTSYDNLSAIVIQPDGKIVAGGFNGTSVAYDYVLVRYNSNGSLDNTFDSDGIVVTAVGTGNDLCMDIALQADSKIVATGISYNGGSIPDYGTVRYNTNGSLDNTFDGDGKVFTDFATFADYAYDVEIQSDGKILIAGACWTGNRDFGLARLNTNGSLDNTFDGDGLVMTDFGSSAEDWCSSIALQADGKIVAGGEAFNGTNKDFALVRYNTNGSLDLTFSSDGLVTNPIGSADDIISSVAIQPDGKNVGVGRINNGSNLDFGVARYQVGPVSVDEENAYFGINLYPNPVINDLNLSSPEPFINVTCRIIDLNGKIVFTQNNLNGNQIKLDVSFLTSGFYMIDIIGETRFQLKWIKD